MSKIVDYRLVVIVVLAGVLALSALTGPVSATGATDTQSPTITNLSTDTDPIVEQITVKRVQSDSSMIEATITYQIPKTVTQLVFGIESSVVAVQDTEHFNQRSEQIFEWTGNGTTGSVTVRYPAQEGFYLDEQYFGAVGWTEEWALVLRPETRTSWKFEKKRSLRSNIRSMLSTVFPARSSRILGHTG